MSSLDDLLEVRERKGLQFVLSFRVFFVTFAFILSFFVSRTNISSPTSLLHPTK